MTNEKITMKEHIEILKQQQDYQFKDGFVLGKKEGTIQARKEELEFLESLFLGGYVPSRAIKIKDRIKKLKSEVKHG